MMTVLGLVEFSEKARLLQIYTNSYCTIIDGDYLYLVENVQINPRNVIAKIDVKENCEIIDRNKANVFIEFSNMHFGCKDNIENLSAQQIQQYIIDFLVQDINELLTFNQIDYSYIEKLVNYFAVEDRKVIYKRMSQLEIDKTLKFTRVYSFEQLNYLLDRQYAYICLNINKKKWAVSDGTNKHYYCNGSGGPWKKLRSSLDFYYIIFFDKSSKCHLLSKDTEALLRRDVELETSTIITHLLKLEDKLTKSLNEMISLLTLKHGLIKVEDVHYPDIADAIDTLEVLLNNYKNANTKEDKLSMFNLLKDKYSYIYSEFSKAQNSLKNLYKQNELTKQEITNG